MPSMKRIRGWYPPSDRALRIALRIGVAALALGLVAFGSVYYLGQRADAGPSLVQRQISAAEQRVRTAPNSIAARLTLAQAYLSAHRPDDAVTQYDEILAAVPDHRAAVLGRAGALLAKGDLTAAAAGYRTITSAVAEGEFAGADPQLEEAHYFLASIAQRQGHPQEAVTEARAALAIESTDSDAWYVLGSALLASGQPEQAADALQRAVLFVPTGWCEPYLALADAYRRLERTPQAEYATAMVDLCQKRPDAAATRLKELTSGPVAAEAMIGLAMIAEQRGRTDEAVSWYRRAIAAEPANTTAIAALSRLGVRPAAAGGKG